jgi:adenosylmethionine-8-amino-7-oxononanoate aminotransferase
MLSDRDRRVVWHPYTQHGLSEGALPVVSARGSTLELEDGTRLIDAISSWWVNLHGHAHPALIEAMRAQASGIDHVVFAGFTHEPAVALAEALTDALAERGLGPTRAFYSDNGSTSVEVALKIAYQYHLNRGDAKRAKFLALAGAYHGDTLGCMSVGGRGGFHAPFEPLLFQSDFIEPGNWSALERAFAEQGDRYAAVIVEPLIQGARGMRLHSREYLAALARLAREHGALLIADEVFTGFGRTGSLFAFEQAGIAPDLVCVSKGLAGGILPLAVTLCREEIFATFLGSSLRRAFLHGHSFTANPIACAVALASWKLLHAPTCQGRIREIAEITRGRVARLERHPGGQDARALGTIGAVNMRARTPGYFANSDRTSQIAASARERGVLLRPLGDVLYAVPPYCVTDTELEQIYDAIEAALD